jgi:trans-aconitate 2-methyltransferase
MTRHAPPREWDAAAYHRLGNPQHAWGLKVLEHLPLTGDETVIDAGCGTGRLTAELLARLPRGHVIALDRSQNMLDLAAEYLTPRFGDRVSFRQADLQTYRDEGAADAVFSTATFHWVLDHPRLFENLHHTLRPGGRLCAQCGGGPNLARIHDRAAELQAREPFAPFFTTFTEPWEFADAETTRARLERAGFVEIETSVVEQPTTFASEQEFTDFITKVVFGVFLERLPDEALRASFIAPLVEQAKRDEPPLTLDYWRLNLRARRAR